MNNRQFTIADMNHLLYIKRKLKPRIYKKSEISKASVYINIELFKFLTIFLKYKKERSSYK